MASRKASCAPLFAALGDDTRLTLVRSLSGGTPRSISQLSEGSPLTRQAVTKHLRVLQGAGLVRSTRQGREQRFALNAQALDPARAYLEAVSAQWDSALQRLQKFVDGEG